MIRLQAKKGWLGIAPSQPINPHIQPCVLVAVVIMLMMLVSSIIRPPSVIRSVIRITAVVAVVAARVIPISRVSVVAVTICGIAEAYSDSSYPD
jgi:predicted secreted protein